MEQLQATADVAALTARISALIIANRPAAARHLLSAVRRLAPPSPAIAELAARVAAGEGHLEQALGELDSAIARFPEHAGLHKHRADLRLQLDDTTGALVDAADAVILDRADPAGKALLGVVLLEHGRADDAIACLHEAVTADPTNPAFRQGLAAALEANGDADAALAALATGIAAAPQWAQLRNAAILVCVRRRDFAAACRLAEEARVAGVADACSFGLLGHALSSLGRHTEAADAYAEALKLGPDDPYVRHLDAYQWRHGQIGKCHRDQSGAAAEIQYRPEALAGGNRRMPCEHRMRSGLHTRRTLPAHTRPVHAVYSAVSR
jgi:Flp pilus assembly protein TadD